MLWINLSCSVSCGISKKCTLVSRLVSVLNLCILERFQDDVTDDMVYYPFGTTSGPAIASPSNLAWLMVSAIMWSSMGAFWHAKLYSHHYIQVLVQTWVWNQTMEALLRTQCHLWRRAQMDVTNHLGIWQMASNLSGPKYFIPWLNPLSRR